MGSYLSGTSLHSFWLHRRQHLPELALGLRKHSLQQPWPAKAPCFLSAREVGKSWHFLKVALLACLRGRSRWIRDRYKRPTNGLTILGDDDHLGGVAIWVSSLHPPVAGQVALKLLALLNGKPTPLLPCQSHSRLPLPQPALPRVDCRPAPMAPLAKPRRRCGGVE